MKRNATFRAWLLPLLLLAIFAGCAQKPPPPDKLKLEVETQQLNEHRQREWNNQ